jgi:protein involved in polysaccharide export with SLBB domain
MLLMLIVLKLGLLSSADGSVFSLSSTFQSQGNLSSAAVSLPDHAFVLVDRDEYILDVSDVLRTTVEGGLSEYLFSCGILPSEMCTVTIDGFINVSGIGSVDVAGATITEAQARLDALVRQYYSSSLHVSLTLHQPRVTSVAIRGMVRNPGSYILSATARVSDLVLKSGGLVFYGSHLGRAVSQLGDSLPVDLSFSAETSRFRDDPFIGSLSVVEMFPCINPVFVNYRGSIVTVDIDPDGISLPDLLHDFAILRGDVNLEQSYISSRDDGTVPFWDQSSGFTEYTVSPFDTLNLAYQDESVFVSGAVYSPGMIPFNPTSTVSWYIQAAGGYLNEANRGNVVVSTPSGVIEDTDIDTFVVQPNSTIEVKYKWIAANSEYIALSMSAISLIMSVLYLTK